jgi:hypothetical protein
MNDKCKYCDYVSKCSRICEYNSILCRAQRSFPKVVDKSYEQLKQENQQLKDNWNTLKEYIKETKLKEFEKSYGKRYGKRYGKTFTQAEVVVCNMILGKMQKIEQGSDSNE